MTRIGSGGPVERPATKVADQAHKASSAAKAATINPLIDAHAGLSPLQAIILGKTSEAAMASAPVGSGEISANAAAQFEGLVARLGSPKADVGTKYGFDHAPKLGVGGDRAAATAAGLVLQNLKLPKNSAGDAKLVAKFQTFAGKLLGHQVETVSTAQAGVVKQHAGLFKQIEAAVTQHESVANSAVGNANQVVHGVGRDDGGKGGGSGSGESDDNAQDQQLVQSLEPMLKTAFSGSDMDIEAMVELVLFACSRDNEKEVRSFIGEMSANMKKRESVGNAINAAKKQRIDLEQEMHGEYDDLVKSKGLGEGVTFAEYKSWRQISYADPVMDTATGIVSYRKASLASPRPMVAGAIPDALKTSRNAPPDGPSGPKRDLTRPVGKYGLSPDLARDLEKIWLALPKSQRGDSFDDWLSNTVCLTQADSPEDVRANSESITRYLNNGLPQTLAPLRAAATTAAQSLAAYADTTLTSIEGELGDPGTGENIAEIPSTTQLSVAGELTALSTLIDGGYLDDDAKAALSARLAAFEDKYKIVDLGAAGAALTTLKNKLNAHPTDAKGQEGKLMHPNMTAYSPLPTAVESTQMVNDVATLLSANTDPVIGPKLLADGLASNIDHMLDTHQPPLTDDQRSKLLGLVASYRGDGDANAFLASVEDLVCTQDYQASDGPNHAVLEALFAAPVLPPPPAPTPTAPAAPSDQATLPNNQIAGTDTLAGQVAPIPRADLPSTVSRLEGAVGPSTPPAAAEGPPQAGVAVRAGLAAGAAVVGFSEGGASAMGATLNNTMTAVQTHPDFDQLAATSPVGILLAHVNLAQPAAADPGELGDRLRALLTGDASKVDTSDWEKSLIRTGVMPDPKIEAGKRKKAIADRAVLDAQLAQAQDKGWTGKQKANGNEQLGNLDNLQAIEDTLHTQSDSLGDMGQMSQMRLQMMMDRRAKLAEMLSNIMKKIADTGQNIIGNMK